MSHLDAQKKAATIAAAATNAAATVSGTTAKTPDEGKAANAATASGTAASSDAAIEPWLNTPPGAKTKNILKEILRKAKEWRVPAKDHQPYENGDDIHSQPDTNANHDDCKSFTSDIKISEHFYSYLRTFTNIIISDIVTNQNNDTNSGYNNEINESRIELDSHANMPVVG